ncbi:unnamed protein product [Caenorhabditis angaria]|uniref:Uncharacterized protein n=1 Tax=Caenorhabditis angaria TaxID=860376 RepID=A0A9P1N1A1_9PELO|nr:unnamed protein product [Caenorhabditis angaria]
MFEWSYHSYGWSTKSTKSPTPFSLGNRNFPYFGEDLLTHLKQPGVCQAFFGDIHEYDYNRLRIAEEKNERLKLRSKKRHLHIVSQLENLELGQNLYGRRSLSSTILNSEHREYRFDQRLTTEFNAVPLKMENRRVIVETTQQLISYNKFEKDFDLSFVEEPFEIWKVFLVDCEQNNRTESFAFVLRSLRFDVYNLNQRDPIKKFILPVIRNCTCIEMNWNKKNESLCIKIGGTYNTFFLLFDILSLECLTSFVVKHSACNKIRRGKISQLELKQDILHIRSGTRLFLYSFPEYWENVGNSRRITDEESSSELPIVFEISRFGRPLFVINETHQIIHVFPNHPFIYVFPRLSHPSFSGNFSHHQFAIPDLKNPETLVNFDQTCTFPPKRRGINFSDFEMLTKNGSALIFADDLTSTFLVFEKFDLVKYYVSNCEETVRQVWKTSIFPNVENRNFYRREKYERSKQNGFGLIFDGDKTLSNHFKIHNAYQSNDGENIIVYLSIENGELLPNGYFIRSKMALGSQTMRFAFIIDDKNGEILRIIPISIRCEKYGRPPCEFTLDDDILLIPEDSSLEVSMMEVWELMEPQQYIIDDN